MSWSQMDRQAGADPLHPPGVPEERVLRYVEKAKRKLHDFRVETPDYVPFPPQSRPTKDFDSEEERQRVRTLLDGT